MCINHYLQVSIYLSMYIKNTFQVPVNGELNLNFQSNQVDWKNYKLSFEHNLQSIPIVWRPLANDLILFDYTGESIFVISAEKIKWKLMHSIVGKGSSFLNTYKYDQSSRKRVKNTVSVSETPSSGISHVKLDCKGPALRRSSKAMSW